MRFFCLLALWILFVSSSVSATSAADEAAKPHRTTTTISFSQSLTGAPLVQVRLSTKAGGLVIGTFVINAASNISCICQTLADRLGYAGAPAAPKIGKTKTSTKKPYRVVEVPYVTIGRFPFQPKFVIVSGKDLTSGYGMSVDGVLGGNMMSVVPMLIDYSQQLIILFAPGHLSLDDLKSVDMGDAIAVPVEDAHGNFDYTCRVAFANGAVKAEEALSIETAGAQTVISAKTAAALHLKPKKPEEKRATVSGPIMWDQASIDHVSLGAATTSDSVTVAYPRKGFPPGTVPQLGLNVLTQYRFLLDFGGKKMYLKPFPVTDSVPVPEL